MAGISYPFAVGRIKGLENKLLDENVWQRLSDAKDESAMIQVLKENNYGSAEDSGHTVNEMVASELNEVDSDIKSLSPDPVLTNLFYYSEDAYNIKMLIKGILIRKDTKSFLHTSGVIHIDQLIEAISDEKYNELPSAIGKAIKAALDLEDPFEISQKIDFAVLTTIRDALITHQNALLKQYFNIVFDKVNILAILRGNALQWNSEKINLLLFDAGSLDQTEMHKAIGQTEDQLCAYLSTGPNRTVYRKILDDYSKHHIISEVESQLDDFAFSIIHEEKNDSFGIGPIINYLLEKRREGSSLRVMAAQKNSHANNPREKDMLR